MNANEQFCFWKRPKLTVLSREQREMIYRSALEVLERTGNRLHSPEAVAILKKAGAMVSDENLVKIPSGIVENALLTAGKRQTLSDRTGKRVIFLEGDNVYFGPGSDNPNTMDLDTGERRTSVLNDVVQAARVGDALTNIDFLMSFALASDIPNKNADCFHFEAMINNTTKPIVITAWDRKGLEGIYEMACIVTGGEAEFRLNPFIILYEQPSSPLKHSKNSLEKLVFCAEKGIPVLYASTPAIGAAGPVTLAGSFVLNVAEFLTALVITQEVKRGSTLVFGGGPTALDMSTTLFSYSAPETMLSLTVRKEMAEFLGFPAFNAGGFSDSKCVDQQAALEAATSLLFAALAGGNLIHDVGYLESGMTSSLEMLAICDEQISLVKRYLQSFKVDKDSLCVDLINEVGPDGDYLGTDHTVRLFREELWTPSITDRNIFSNWLEQGSTTLKERAGEKVRHLLKNYTPQPLSAEVSKAVREITNKFESIR